jgi:hypothetical protein
MLLRTTKEEPMRLRIALLAATLLLLVTTGASARRRCTIDLEPLLSVHYFRSVVDDATIRTAHSRGIIVISKGGAVTMMRTERQDAGPGPKIFVSGQLRHAELRALRNSLAEAVAGDPAPCFVESTPDPPTGVSVDGGAEYTVYRGGLPPLRFSIQRSDPNVPLPRCEAASEALDTWFFALADAMREGVRPLQCLP